MDNRIRNKAKRLTARRRLKSTMARIAIAMSGLAVFCVVYILLAPGLTAEWPLQCELEEHVHDESCYTLVEAAPGEAEDAPDAAQAATLTLELPAPVVSQPELICGLEETEGHSHGEACYTAVRGALLCGAEESEDHSHSDDCYAWTQELCCGLEETEGHSHSDACYSVPEPVVTAPEGTGETGGTEPDAAPEGEPAGDAAQPEAHYELTCGKEEHTHSDGCYIIPEGKETYNCGFLTEHTHKDDCYFENGELKCTIPEHLHDDSCLAQPMNVTLEESFRYETDISVIDFHISGEAAYTVAPETETESETEDDAAEAEADGAEPAAAGLEFQVTLSEDQDEYDDYEALISADGDVLAMQILHFSLSMDGRELDLSNCEITADITPTEMLRDYAENGAELMTLAAEDETGETADMGILLAASGSDDAYEAAALSDESDGTVTVPVTGRTLRTAAIAGANPHFTVQYYAMLSRVTQEQPESGSYSELAVINTDNGGNGTGGNLPQNGEGVTPPLTNLYVGADGRLATTTELTKIYKDEGFEYFQAPGLQYFNVVINNTESNYDTFQIWVLKEGGSADSLNQDDWTVYEYDRLKTRFTNRPETVQPDNGYILIEDGTVIRLVYNPAAETVDYDAKFYDYDISDGPVSPTQMYTDQNGINTPISGSGTQLVFGNGGSGVNANLTTKPSAQWRGNYPNVYNRKKNQNGDNIKPLTDLGYKGCTFGLASSLTAAGDDVVFASDIKAPSLFGNSNGTGKTITNIDGLSFNRVGDTYTLSAVPKANLYGLDVLGHPQAKYPSIWTNNFWPVDHAATRGKDILFGAAGSNKKFQPYGTWNNLPASDDGTDHNSYFGMHFGVSFELTKNYVGPLEYYFFGDDDMWVFLECPNGETKLICDIGGVHTSVGEYVNLWDYIDKGALENLGKDANGKDQKLKYNLKFFYTERGASGSTCWMQFTLPTVVGLDLDEYLDQKVTESTGALRIEKRLDGVENTQDFTFKLSMKNKNGVVLPDNYLVRTANGELLEGEDVKEYPISGNDIFTLKGGDVMVIYNLPEGTEYIIEEIDSDGYNTTIERNDKTDTSTILINGAVVSGSVSANFTSKVVYTNHASYELPATGGSGTILLYAAGSALILFALILMCHRNTRRKGGAAC